MKPEDSGLFLAKCIQAILSTHQEATRTEQIPFGFATFTQKCGWPSLESAPYVDEVVKELMDAVRAPNFAELCRTKPGYEFSLRKGLELLFVQGYGWSEFYNEFLRTDLFKMMIDGERYRIALPLVAAVARETRFDSADAAAVNTTSIQKFLEAILDSDAKTDHQAEAALAVVVMSNGRASRLTKVREWVGALGDEVRPKLPSLLQRALF
ncbi:hypothetical protein BC939DRAFT_440995 [Gamsiella multidivaricata]|uniref:uncharacterized protein n=1 Tax=Gamsiella multidivaricata TaxID=101098 RepID=UPI0022201ADB|nr:uncharacterized protein BC939DRAFT_440995 [Gamsiella multidivaricata]KAI7829531.1 hypothetical protein BC939DRAFT_440995 [Gamsiella multidivaricata]